MAQWANFLISAVRYNSDHTHIIQVQQHVDSDTSVGIGQVVSRQTVVSNIKSRYTYATIYSNDGKRKLGQRIIIDPVNGIEYIKTLADRTTRDNLGELPEF